MVVQANEMLPGVAQRIVVHARYINQNASMAVQDVYDALIELITNADDRYQVLRKIGEIEIEIERKRKGQPTFVRVRDFADGMTLETMKEKLAQLGKRVSGMEDGYDVRGTNSRGAKDVAVLGGVTFESIAEDVYYHKCEITDRLDFIPYEPSHEVTVKERRELGIRQGTGTLVTMTVARVHKVPQHQNLKRKLCRLVQLREILKKHRIILRDLNQNRENVIQAPLIPGKDRVKELIQIPGYPKAQAKLIIRRAPKRFEDRRSKFRLGGILNKSRHAIHEATYFAPELENDPHAGWFFGRLTCPYIDELWNDYDNRFENQLERIAENPCPIYDPLRKQGLSRSHPFTKALFPGGA